MNWALNKGRNPLPRPGNGNGMHAKQLRNVGKVSTQVITTLDLAGTIRNHDATSAKTHAKINFVCESGNHSGVYRFR
eukprot:3973993-Amphidinium_carterae.1